MSQDNIKHTFDFLEELKKGIKNEHEKIITALLKNVKEISDIAEKERSKIPKEFNLLELVGGTSEPKHSNILGALLTYQCNKQSIFLQSFFKFLDLNFLTVEEPKVSVEKNNIDILIEDTNYALIIENKINNANDQPEQIKRYVDIVKEKYNKKKIYVAYLTRSGTKKVSKDSCPEGLKKELGGFLDINYHGHILPWLQDALLELPIKEEILISGMRQYIDTLKGMFNLRKNQKNMTDTIKKVLIEQLKLKDMKATEQLEIIEKQYEEFQTYNQGLESLKNDLIYEIGGKPAEERAKKIKEYFEKNHSDLIDSIKLIDGEFKKELNISDKRGIKVKLKHTTDDKITSFTIWANHEYREKEDYSYIIRSSNDDFKKEFQYCENPTDKEQEFLNYVSKILDMIKENSTTDLKN